MPNRFAAKLLFQSRVESDRESIYRICQSTIILVRTGTALSALKEIQRRGKHKASKYKNSTGKMVFRELVGIAEMIRLDDVCEADEVWYDVFQLKRPSRRIAEHIPPPGSSRQSSKKRAQNRDCFKIGDKGACKKGVLA